MVVQVFAFLDAASAEEHRLLLQSGANDQLLYVAVLGLAVNKHGQRYVNALDGAVAGDL